MSSPIINIIRQGDTTKPDPFTIVVVSNPALEAPWESMQFITDPITADQPAFNSCVRYIDNALFGNLPNQRERFMADPAIAPRIRVVSLFISGLAAQDSTSLVAQDSLSNILVARRSQFVPFLSAHGLAADIVYAVSKSVSHNRASAWFTSDNDSGPGVGFTLDGVPLFHRHFNLIPGTVALHSTSQGLTALHEFGHALSSYTNGSIIDLYVDSNPDASSLPAVNYKRGRPIPAAFGAYNGTVIESDMSRDGLGYPPSWQSYHCELIDQTVPAVMDNYLAAPVPEHCLHDKVTRRFLIDRLRAKIAR